MWQLLKEDVRCIFERDPAARNVLDVLTTYSGVHALLLHRVNHWLWGPGAALAAALPSPMLGRWLTGIEIHPAARIGRRFFVDHGTGVVIGETAEIGDDVTLYQGVTLGGRTLDAGKRHPTLGDDVVVGGRGQDPRPVHRRRRRPRRLENAVVLEGGAVRGDRGRRAGRASCAAATPTRSASSSCATRARRGSPAARLRRLRGARGGGPRTRRSRPIEGLRAEIRELHHELDALRRSGGRRRGARHAGGPAVGG